jgi:hypothetical protein
MMKNLISRIDILQGPLASACARPTVSSSVVLGLFTATHPVMRSLCEEEKWGFLRWKYDIWIWHPLVIQHSYWMLLNICQKSMIMMIQLLNVVIFPYSYCTSTWNPTFFSEALNVPEGQHAPWRVSGSRKVELDGWFVFFLGLYREDKQDKLIAYPAYPSCLKVDLRLAAVCDIANGSTSNMLFMAVKFKPHGIYRFWVRWMQVLFLGGQILRLSWKIMDFHRSL